MKHQKNFEWVKLDNASKMFPATWSLKDPKVFRIHCELLDIIDPNVLQKALDITINDFPLYRSVLRRGVFWYYLESSEITPEVTEESKPVCAPVYVGLKNNLLFRVTYYNKRINLEIFHVLSDGAGAVRFLTSLVCRYLALCHREAFAASALSPEDFSMSERMDDSYKKHYIGGEAFRRLAKAEKKRNKRKAYQIRGMRTAENRVALIEGAMPTEAVLVKAHSYNASLTVFISSLFIYSIYKEMPTRKKNQPIVLTVPVNLRQFFESGTARNFFGFIDAGFNFEKNTDDLGTITCAIGERFKECLTEERLNYQLYKNMAMQQNPLVRGLPLPIKDLLIRAAARSYDRYTTSNISNIGRIVLPPEFCPYIRQFGVCTSVRRPQLTLCSYEGRLVISITSPYKETAIQMTFFRLLSKMGITVEIASNI
ncbi:MAG: hypothetical protein AB7D36_09665 [Oscillospiraceae bacterium]